MPHTGQRMMREGLKPALPLTWAEIVAMDEAALNLAIEEYIYGRKWQPMTSGTETYGYCRPMPDPSPFLPHTQTRLRREVCIHTTDWARTMSLAWRYGVSVQVNAPNTHGIVWYQESADDGRQIQVHSEDEARMAVCRVALWRAVQSQGVTP